VVLIIFINDASSSIYVIVRQMKKLIGKGYRSICVKIRTRDLPKTK